MPASGADRTSGKFGPFRAVRTELDLRLQNLHMLAHDTSWVQIF